MPAAQAIDRAAEAQVRIHLQGREADVHPVEPGDHVQQQQVGQQPPAQPSIKRLFVDHSRPPAPSGDFSGWYQVRFASHGRPHPQELHR